MHMGACFVERRRRLILNPYRYFAYYHELLRSYIKRNGPIYGAKIGGIDNSKKYSCILYNMHTKREWILFNMATKALLTNMVLLI